MSARFRNACLGVVLGALALAPAAFDFAGAQTATPPGFSSVEALGRALFFDRNLSFSRTQACVSCHSPELAFIDPRELPKAGGAVSLGGDGHSLGDRNAPSIAYARLTPEFHLERGEPVGGFFWDGRARTLEDQAGGPPLNPVEMGMPDKQSVVARLKENPDYVSAFHLLYGEGSLDNADEAYSAMTKAIAAFERLAEFSPFDSKYDRSLSDEAALNGEEARGRDIFFSRERSNCTACHLSARGGSAKTEIFTNSKYYNLGTPANLKVRALNGSKAGFVDRGLASNPAVSGLSFDGRFKVPGLRNVAVTGPYMHNGIFEELRTVLLFHGRFAPGGAQINPETGQPWEAPETSANLALDILKTAPALSESETGALIAFLKTLTDQNYMRLVEK